jgi:ribosomal protein L34
MKVRIRKSNLKRARKCGFLARKKTRGGRKIIARQRRKYGHFRGPDR